MSKESIRARIEKYEQKHKASALTEEEVTPIADGMSDITATPIETAPVQELNKTATPSGPIPGPDTGISNMLINAINGEWDTIALYNDLITNLSAQGMNDIVEIITDINNEENIHVGQLQKALEKLSPNASSIKDGEEEASKDLAEG